ncbi:NAD-dependent epimerase/dehydratase family protein [Lapillicoccus jejuensis]|uniref:UDP-glucose 4-epimerase n=1 Tax=Lapillicoccus jejuensis TaxID=402171 RepID=A0A542DVZ8_9MICO|nr:NAD-dependent epimerase/dehydratase family protein [Lapillicoccus jejuensis]TQJ07281.1 UDP-glucose 4-epimerase [Lapillicoccus jejuensis]
MRLLITGAAGFIGSNLARAALAAGHQVVGLDDLSNGRRENLDGLGVELHEGSLLEPAVLEAAVQGADSVVHLAALGSVPRSLENPLRSHHANATGTLALLEAARAAGVGHVVAASSSSVYGLNPALPKDERQWVRPLSPYAVSKLATEQYVLAYQQSFGLDTLAFRFFNVYGPRQQPGHAYAAVVPIFLDALLSGRPLPVHGDGSQSRDFTYVGTVCRALMSAVERRVSHPEPVNLAFGTNTTLLELVRRMEGVTGREARVEHHPSRPGDVRASQADNSRLRELLPDLEPTPLDDGLVETVRWFEERR